jgi:hypothetical protein
MPKLLTTASTLTCPHGGTVQIVGTNRTTTATAPLALATDTYLVVGCPFVLVIPPHPCVRVAWLATAQRVKVNGEAVLNEASVGLCYAADNAPQGAVVVAATQQKVDGV